MLQDTTKYCMLHTYHHILHACMLEHTGRGGVAWEGEEREKGERRKRKKGRKKEEREERGEREKRKKKREGKGEKKKREKKKDEKNIKERPTSSPLRRPPGGGDNSAEQPKS